MNLRPESQREPQPEPVVRVRQEWTPQRGLIKGCAGCLIAGGVLGTLWCLLAYHEPRATVCFITDDARESFGTGVVNALSVFIIAWILFAVMHRASRMVGSGTTVAVVVFTILVILAKQLVLVSRGAAVPAGLAAGWAWMEPAALFKSNLGGWFGLVGAVLLFRNGDSIWDLGR